MISDLDLEKIKTVHFIGIGGIGISAIARMMLLQGKKVSGSDAAESPITKSLVDFGATIVIGQSAENINPEVAPEEYLVVYTVAIGEANPELAEVRRRGLRAFTYPQMLGIISREKFTIAVAGSHGKTTTTAMIANIMIDAGLDPTVIVGSLMKSSGTNLVVGKSKYLVVEACEYKRSFLNLSPKIAVITNIDDDHLDYYKDIAGVQKGFQEFVDLLPSSIGKLVCNQHGANMFPAISFAGSTVDYSEISDGEIPKLKIPGRHNIENAKAALAVARLLGIADDQSLKSLADFSGTWRRFEFLGTTKNGALIYDDYAHHPTEIRATLGTVREFFPGKKIILVFQPHLFSRTKEHLEEFADCFKNVDELIIAPIYAAREPNDPSVSAEILAEKIRGGASAGVEFAGDVKTFADSKAIESYLRDSIGPSDVLITMGAGDINSVAIAMLQ